MVLDWFWIAYPSDSFAGAGILTVSEGQSLIIGFLQQSALRRQLFGPEPE